MTINVVAWPSRERYSAAKMLEEVGTLFTPDTILRWHRMLVARRSGITAIVAKKTWGGHAGGLTKSSQLVVQDRSRESHLGLRQDSGRVGQPGPQHFGSDGGQHPQGAWDRTSG